MIPRSIISAAKQKELAERMAALGIDEKDLVEKFIHAQGRGGQKVNTSSACVYLKHVPTGIEVKCQETRSRAQNRFFARRILADRIEAGASRTACDRRRIRKQKDRRARRARTQPGPIGSEGK